MLVTVFALVFGIPVILSVCEVFVVLVSEAMAVCFKLSLDDDVSFACFVKVFVCKLLSVE